MKRQGLYFDALRPCLMMHAVKYSKNSGGTASSHRVFVGVAELHLHFLCGNLLVGASSLFL